jgi:hypothetical protein
MNSLRTVFKLQEHVLDCAEKQNPTAGVREHITKIRQSIADVNDDMKSKSPNEQDSTDKLIKYFKLMTDKTYQMHILNKCPNEIIQVHIKGFSSLKPRLMHMKTDLKTRMKGLNAKTKISPLTKEGHQYIQILSKQLIGFNNNLSELLQCASKTATTSISDHIKQMEILNNGIIKHVDTLNSSKTVNDMINNAYSAVVMLVDMASLATSQKYLKHVYKNCQNEIYKANAANINRTINMISMFAKQVKKNTSK